MKVKVGSYYHDESKGAQREIHIELDDSDGEELCDNWHTLSHGERYVKLRAFADIYMLKYAASRGLRSEDVVANDIRLIYSKDLS